MTKQKQAKSPAMTGAPTEKTTDTFRPQTADVNSKRIFENPVLMAQFLRDYSGLPELANVKPEDIETVRLRYHLFDEVELSSDSAARVLLVKRENGMPIYIVPLMDHKSRVDYNVAMQLFYYMACIWKDWEKEAAQYGYDCKTADFRYPMVYPIVYYEGREKWTADLNFSARIDPLDSLKAYTPEFRYHVVGLHKHSNEELLKKEDEMSLIMILNKIQDAADFNEFKLMDNDSADRIIEKTPEDILNIIAGIVLSLCRRLNVPEGETDDFLEKIRKERRMGYLFENMEKMDIQAERRKTERQRQLTEQEKQRTEKEKQRADEAEQRADEAEQRADEAEQRADEAEQRADEAERRVAELQEQLEALQKMVADMDTP